MKKITLLFGILFFLIGFQPAFAARYYVDQSATGANNGSSWLNAFTTLQAALSIAIPDDEIWVASNTFIVSETLVIPSGVELYGGFAGTETAVSQRDLSTNPTFLNADIGTPGDIFDNVRIMSFLNSGEGTSVDGFQFINGWSSQGGGAILIDNSWVRVRNCKFFFNHGSQGGTLRINESDVEVVNCEFRNNSTAGSAANGGSAAYIAGGMTFFAECIFVDNLSEGHGGAIRAESGIVGVGRCALSSNISILDGGAIYVGAADFSIFNSLIVGNVSNTGGGSALHAVPSGSNMLIVINCAISGNRNSFLGSSTAFQSNNATQIINSIFSDNTGSTQISNGSGGAPTIANSIIVGTFDNTNATNIFTGDPQFVSPGSGLVAPFSHEDYDYNLLLISPGINAGNSDAAVGDFDLAGNPRIVETVDIGPYEYSTLAVPTNDQQLLSYYFDPLTEQIIFMDFEMIAGSNISVYDLTGKLLHSETVQNPAISFSAADGIYILKLDGHPSGKLLVR